MSPLRMTSAQIAKAKRLIRAECANYDLQHNECFTLDDGCGCACVQAISCSLLCRYFQTSVLPLDPIFESNLLKKNNQKTCIRCGRPFVPTGRNAKYCPVCSKSEERRRKAEYNRRKRQSCGRF